MTVRVRIAPSPTGNLHIGTARTAVFNWLFARHNDGKFILRIEDTDLERSKPEYVENITSGLRWLGLNWDEGPFFQTKRTELYSAAIQMLLDQGLAYKCYCTNQELEQMREEQKARQEAPRYDNRHRHLDASQQSEFEAQGRRPVIRFIIEEDQKITWQDEIRGDVTWDTNDLGGDMVVARASESEEFGVALYNLAVVVDDIDMDITHVIRGEDHIANTAKQILLYRALGALEPVFAHTPLILNSEGRKLSKRDGVTSIDDFRKMGFLPEALANYMTLLGWTPPDAQEIFSLEQASSQFELERVNRAGAKFDWDKLDWINSQYIHNCSTEQLMELLLPYWQQSGYQINQIEDRDWLLGITELIKGSLKRLSDAPNETNVLFGSSIEFTQEAIDQLKIEQVGNIIRDIAQRIDEPLDSSVIDEIINTVTKTHNVKKGLVMKSLRAALMGSLQGHDLKQSWLLLNKKGWDKPRLASALELI